MKNIVVNYFCNLYTSVKPSSDNFERVTRTVQCRVSDGNRILLDRLFSVEEIRKAAFDMHPTKASGPDGLPALFYQRFWSAVGEGITSACLRCLNEGDSVDIISNTLIALITKGRQAECMADIWPISLYNVTYKIVAKALANRFRLVLGEVVSKT
ncbi:hypothetical protein Dsin_012281 [Dipteronia sinensis]|uniref:Reverse transcriptase n=1 Tax=Dipteronia sinensis TaxID=43782 RepID=A0AAE0AHZ5_9ROSI|nr:hypothetical protein Dsin_012281 [Dipteronia sinensis]